MGKTSIGIVLAGCIAFTLGAVTQTQQRVSIGYSTPSSSTATNENPDSWWGYCRLTQYAPDRVVFSPVFEFPFGTNERREQMRNVFYSRYTKDYADNFGCPYYRTEEEATSRRNGDIAGPSSFRVEHIALPFPKGISQEERASAAARKGGNGTSGLAAPSPPQKSPRELAVDAEVKRLGAHRRAEAERLVDMRMAAEKARPKPVAGSAAKPTPSYPAYVPRPPLPQTKAPKGFFDSNQFVAVSDPTEARSAFDRQYGSCRGKIQYLTSACYPDGMGRYSCQARVRCPIGGPSRVRAE